MDAPHPKQQLLQQLYRPFTSCTGCHFQMPRATQIVFGEGNPNATLMFIGEAPGREEDLQGKPFVGRSGKLLDKILDALGTKRGDAFITNIVKCRPPNNRKPLPAEMTISRPLLFEQIKIIRPRIICTLGAAALEGLLEKEVKITAMRGKKIDWNGLIVVPAYHPAFILRNPKELKTLIADISLAYELSQSD